MTKRKWTKRIEKKEEGNETGIKVKEISRDLFPGNRDCDGEKGIGEIK